MLFPYTTLFRSRQAGLEGVVALGRPDGIRRRWLRSVRDLHVPGRSRGTREREEHEHLREFRGRDAGQRVLMSWWVEDVDAVYEECVKQGIEVTWRPTDMPWNVREMHVRHPDGHVFRIGKGLKEE